MGKYQPKIIQITEDIINGMEYDGFLKRFNITNIDFIKKYLLDLLTEKFINDDLEDEDGGIFTEEEFDKMLIDIVKKHAIQTLVNDGVINTYEDETTDEVVFLTKKGKKLMEELKNKIEKSTKD